MICQPNGLVRCINSHFSFFSFLFSLKKNHFTLYYKIWLTEIIHSFIPTEFLDWVEKLGGIVLHRQMALGIYDGAGNRKLRGDLSRQKVLLLVCLRDAVLLPLPGHASGLRHHHRHSLVVTSARRTHQQKYQVSSQNEEKGTIPFWIIVVPVVLLLLLLFIISIIIIISKVIKWHAKMRKKVRFNFRIIAVPVVLLLLSIIIIIIILITISKYII